MQGLRIFRYVANDGFRYPLQVPYPRKAYLCILWDDVFHYTANMLSDKFLKCKEGIGMNSRLSEFPISPGRLAFYLANTYAVTIPEERYSKWQTLEQAVNTVFSLLASDGERLK